MQNRSLCLAVYEGLWVFLIRLLRLYASLRPRFQPKIQERDAGLIEISAWGRIRSRFPKCVIFVCSSAGEYEQAKPLLERFLDRKDTALFILFYSPSGIRFAQSQGESIPYALIASDRPSYWRGLCVDLRPDAVFCVRYELWPGLVFVTRNYAPLYLINGVEAGHLREKRFARILRSFLVRPMNRIFVVAESDREFYESILKVSPYLLMVAGETKYDRVLERIDERRQKLKELKSSLEKFLTNRRILVLGSAWPRDLEEFMAIYQDLKQFDPEVAVILAPHDLSASNITVMQGLLSGTRVCQVSRNGYIGAMANHDILLVDVLGDLPELYGCAELAWVGGALHFRVHNVLEPACRGLYLCFGPQYQTSQEAKVLVSDNLAQVIHTGSEFLEWYKTLNFALSPPNQAMQQAVLRQQGASDRILEMVTAFWRS